MVVMTGLAVFDISQSFLKRDVVLLFGSSLAMIINEIRYCC